MTESLGIFEDLVRVETRLWNQLDRTLMDKHELSLAWLMALRVMRSVPGSRVQDVAEDLDISPGGASKLVERLVIAGLVNRSADESDRRVSRLRLTPRGRRLVQVASATSEAWLSEQFRQALGPQGADELQSPLGGLLVQARARDAVA